MTMCVSCSAALPFVVFGSIIVEHIVKIGRCRCSGHLAHWSSGFGRQGRSGVEALEDIHRTPLLSSSGFLSRGSRYARRRAVVCMIECAVFSEVMV